MQPPPCKGPPAGLGVTGRGALHGRGSAFKLQFSNIRIRSPGWLGISNTLPGAAGPGTTPGEPLPQRHLIAAAALRSACLRRVWSWAGVSTRLMGKHQRHQTLPLTRKALPHQRGTQPSPDSRENKTLHPHLDVQSPHRGQSLSTSSTPLNLAGLAAWQMKKVRHREVR